MSPIEDLLATHLAPIAVEYGWRVQQGVRLHKYTADFVITARGNHFVIECDGHDYHERTKEQAARDRRRDRYLLVVFGLFTIRFTGSEIHRDPQGCVDEIAEIVIALDRDRLQAFNSGLDEGFTRGVEHVVESWGLR